MVSGAQCPYVGVCKDEMVRGAVAPEGPMTYDSTGQFSPVSVFSSLTNGPDLRSEMPDLGS